MTTAPQASPNKMHVAADVEYGLCQEVFGISPDLRTLHFVLEWSMHFHVQSFDNDDRAYAVRQNKVSE